VLLKPGRLTDQERCLIEDHPLIGLQIVRPIELANEVLQFIGRHHEKLDGSGYPDGLRGEAIPIGSAIILVSDAFDAMTTHRAYRSVLSLQMTMQELQRCSGRQFDPRVVEAFVGIVGRQGINALHWSRVGAR
jgi:HD-GYP domain-containing protein (c-di-GMP phosphodiesterase class II)